MMGEWIRCDERMPAVDTEVWIWAAIILDNIPHPARWRRARLHYSNDTLHWQSLDDWALWSLQKIEFWSDKATE